MNVVYRELCPVRNEELKTLLAQSKVLPTTPTTPMLLDRFRQQTAHIFLINVSDKATVSAVTKLGRTLGFKLLGSYSNRVTHVVVRTDDPAVVPRANLFSAILQGQWIVDHKCRSRSLAIVKRKNKSLNCNVCLQGLTKVK